MLENWNINSFFILIALILSSASFVIQLYLFIRDKKKSFNDLCDEEYIREYIRSVGRYLEIIRFGENYKNLNYNAPTADIFRHIPFKYWCFVEKIDRAMIGGQYDDAWDILKLLSQVIAIDKQERKYTLMFCKDKFSCPLYAKSQPSITKDK